MSFSAGISIICRFCEIFFRRSYCFTLWAQCCQHLLFIIHLMEWKYSLLESSFGVKLQLYPIYIIFKKIIFFWFCFKSALSYLHFINFSIRSLISTCAYVLLPVHIFIPLVIACSLFGASPHNIRNARLFSWSIYFIPVRLLFPLGRFIIVRAC